MLFQFDKSNLTPRARAILGPLAAKIKSRAVGPVQVTGYTDSIGTNQVNIPLSHARAVAVVAALQPALPGVTLRANGLGAADPVAPNTKPDGTDNPAGRALNRRVTITFAVKAPATATPPVSAPAASAAQGAATRTVSYPRRRQPESLAGHHQRPLPRGQPRGDEAVDHMRARSRPDLRRPHRLHRQPERPPGHVHAELPRAGLHRVLVARRLLFADPTTGTEYIPVYQGTADPLTSLITNNMARARLPGLGLPVRAAAVDDQRHGLTPRRLTQASRTYRSQPHPRRPAVRPFRSREGQLCRRRTALAGGRARGPVAGQPVLLALEAAPEPMMLLTAVFTKVGCRRESRSRRAQR